MNHDHTNTHTNVLYDSWFVGHQISFQCSRQNFFNERFFVASYFINHLGNVQTLQYSTLFTGNWKHSWFLFNQHLWPNSEQLLNHENRQKHEDWRYQLSRTRYNLYYFAQVEFSLVTTLGPCPVVLLTLRKVNKNLHTLFRHKVLHKPSHNWFQRLQLLFSKKSDSWCF